MMASSSVEQQYLHDLNASLAPSHELGRILQAPSRAAPRVFHTEIAGGSKILPKDVLMQTEQDHAVQKPSVCVIESIDREWIGALGSKWQIPSRFFEMHASNSTSLTNGGAIVESRTIGFPNSCVHYTREGEIPLLTHARSVFG